MKTISLTNIQKPELLGEVLSNVLPGQKEPWLLLTPELHHLTSAVKKPNGDGIQLFTQIVQSPIAYFNIANEGGVTNLYADVSGRHFNEDQAVIDVLRKISKLVGGVVEDDNGNCV